MRDYQQQLIDLQNVVIKGLRDIRRRRITKHTYPILLEGAEGVIIRDLLELITTGDKDTGLKFAGSIFFEDSPVLCSKEFPGLDIAPVKRILGENPTGEYSGAHGGP
ncbi:hypothetical protein LCGC14_2697300 [marine sediment metagenome]|uniref:Uncharacterized protein n=1 Tax=marine sediment metagenome TaxID=412755 RepID=A0A0F9BR76_9ZZZZ